MALKDTFRQMSVAAAAGASILPGDAPLIIKTDSNIHHKYMV